MAARPGVRGPDARDPAVDMRVLRRLAIWGSAATGALIVVAIATYSHGDTRRLAAASPASTTAPTSKGDAMGAQLALRVPELDAETRRLAEAVRALTNEREALKARIGALERSVEDMTGSTKRQAAAAPAAPAAVVPTLASITPIPAPKPASEPSAAPSEPVNLEKIAALPRQPEIVAEPPPVGGLGIDVGGANNFEGLRTLWTSIKNANAALMDGLHPLVVVRENNRSKSPELRLVVGPVASVEAAARMCTVLAAAKRYCQPVAFEGQRLIEPEGASDRKSEGKPEAKLEPKLEPKPESKSDSKPDAKPEHKPEPKSERRASTKPKPAKDSTPSVLRIFR
jgi:hypothetical protein